MDSLFTLAPVRSDTLPSVTRALSLAASTADAALTPVVTGFACSTLPRWSGTLPLEALVDCASLIDTLLSTVLPVAEALRSNEGRFVEVFGVGALKTRFSDAARSGEEAPEEGLAGVSRKASLVLRERGRGEGSERQRAREVARG